MSSSSTAEPPPYKRDRSALHGYGLFATSDLPVGTVVLHERSIWSLHKNILNHPPTLLKIYRALPFRIRDKLLIMSGGFETPAEGRKFIDAASREGAAQRLWAICNDNGQTEGDDDNLVYALYGQLSRVNHSCAHNCELIGAAGSDGATLVTVNRVKEGEELTQNYGEPFWTYAQRKEFLDDTYGMYQCNCTMCSMDEARRKASDKRREELAAGTGFLAEYVRCLKSAETDDPAVLVAGGEEHERMCRLAESMMVWMKLEHIAGEEGRKVMDAARRSARACGWPKKALRYHGEFETLDVQLGYTSA